MATQQKKDIEKASDVELLEFAELTLQLPDAKTASDRATLLGLIRSTWPNDYIFVDSAATPEADEAQADDVRAMARIKLGEDAPADEPRWIIKISATELPGGKDPVPVGVNGRAVVIQRDMEAEVPHRYVEALQHAVRTAVTQDQRTHEFHYTNFTNYPLEVIERPTRAEIEAWKEKSRDLVLT